LHNDQAVAGLIDRLPRTTDPARRRELLAGLVRLYHREAEYKGSWWGTRPDTTGPYYHRATWEATPQIEAALVQQLQASDHETVQYVLGELARHKVKLKGLPADLVKLAKEREAARVAADIEVKIPPFDPQNPKQLGNIELKDILKHASSGGDMEVGRALFKQQSCLACHTVSADQSPIGPYLGDIGKRYNRQQLIESIVKPSAQIAQGFATNWIVTTKGRQHNGFVIREAADEVEIRTAEGKTLIFAKADIEERGQSKLSVMPDGVVKNLTVEELSSLLAYLESLK